MNPILFKFGYVTLYSYGLMVGLGFMIAAMLAAKQAKDFNIAPDNITTLALVILISGVIGARALFVLLNLADFVSNPIEIFMVTHGGLVFYGGAIAAFLSSLIYIKTAKMPMLDAADLISPYIALGHAIGRIGCFLNGCCYGKPSNGFLSASFQDGITRIPTQIYSSLYLLLVYMGLRVLLRYRKFRGQLFFSYLILYSAGRFFIEFLRGDSPSIFFGLTFSQIVSAVILVFGLAGYSLRWHGTQ